MSGISQAISLRYERGSTRAPMTQFSQAVKAINWRHALGELTLIVVGVLVALAANSWWEDRRDRQRERAYLQQLLADVRETQNRLEYSLSGDSIIESQAARFLEAADTATAAPTVDSLYAWSTIDYRTFRPITGTYDALVRNGDPEVISSYALRLRIISYAAAIEAAGRVLGHTEALIWRNLERRDLALLRHRLRGAGPRRWQSTVDADALLRDPELLNTVSMQRGASGDRVAELRKLRSPTAELRQMLEATLQGR